MLTLDLTPSTQPDSERDQDDNYPEEVMQSEWNPTLKEVHTLLVGNHERVDSNSEIIDRPDLRKGL